MDLSHLVTIGLMPAKRAPLSSADHEYFQKHGVEQVLSDIVNKLAAQKPADPYKFIADLVAPMSKGGAAPAAAPAPAAKAAAKDAGKKAAPAAAKAAPAAPAAKPAAASAPGGATAESVGDEIRALKEKLKSEGLSGKNINDHDEVKRLVAQLQELKAAGGGAAPAAAPAAAPKAKAEPKAAAKAEGKKEKGGGGGGKKDKKTEDALAKGPSKGGGVEVKKADDVPLWYEQVIMKSELIEQYPVKGCFILRPWAYRIWELIQKWFDFEIKELGVENCYFPMFIPKCYMEKESDHLDDFAPELAMVTKFGNTELEEPVAIRPTSETAMYAAYSNWIQSHRDLPVKLNQWCSVVRWEVKQTTPFLRTREFLWQEGHTAYAEKAAAEKEVLDILELYALVYEKLLAVPVVRGTKTKAETFPGADYTTTVEAFIPATGRAIQGATSHHLGQNFSKMFDITFQDPNDPTGKLKDFAHQNSWGITQRTLGVMIMVHGDDKGLVLPPAVAGLQVVIVIVGLKATSPEADRHKVKQTAMDHYMKLSSAGIRVKLDERDQSPGWKFNYWEMKGVPLRIEIGPMDIEKGEFVMAQRHISDPKASKVSGKAATVVEDVKKTLDNIQSELYSRALSQRDDRLVQIDQWKDFSPNLNQGKLVLVPFCAQKDCEEMIKDKSKEEAQDVEVAGGLKMGAKSLCIPHEAKFQGKCPGKCINPDCPSGIKVEKRTLFGRSY